MYHKHDSLVYLFHNVAMYFNIKDIPRMGEKHQAVGQTLESQPQCTFPSCMCCAQASLFLASTTMSAAPQPGQNQ